MKNNDFKKVRIKNRTCYYFDDVLLLEFMIELDI